MSASPARVRAREVISQVRERSGYAHEVFDSRLRASPLPLEETALATRLTYGALQTEGTLDEALGRYLEGRKLEPRVRDALRIATYELLFLRTLPRAAVHQGVELVRAIRPQAAGLANAVLRRLADDAPAFPWGDPDTDVAVLARLHGHPLWLAEMWVAELGRDAAVAVMTADNEPAPLYVAVNPFAGTSDVARAALDADGAQPGACPVAGCFELGAAPHAVHGSALRDGLVLACDAAAQMVVRLVGALPAQRVLEVGSGRGTKTLLLQGAAVANGGPADIYALDLHAFKARLLAERLACFDVPRVTALVGDARDILAVEGIGEPESFDAVLIDAPCSGLGTLRRHPEKRWRVTPRDLDSLGDLGLRMLEQAAALVRQGGFMVYSTCTVTRRENAAVVESFLAGKQGSDWHVDPLANDIPAPWQGFVTEEGYFSSLPVSGGPETN